MKLLTRKSSWEIVGQSSVAVSHTGDTNETTLATITIPANQMGANGRLRITAHWSYPNSANNKITRIRFGGGQMTAATIGTGSVQQHILIGIGNRNALNSQIVSIPGLTSGLGVSSTAVTTAAIDTSINRDVTLTVALALDSETISLESYLVEMMRA